MSTTTPDYRTPDYRTPDYRNTITTAVCIEPGPHRAHTMHVYTDGGRRLIGTKQCPGKAAVTPIRAGRHRAALGDCVTCWRQGNPRPATQTQPPAVHNGLRAGTPAICDDHAQHLKRLGNSRSIITGTDVVDVTPTGRYRADVDPAARDRNGAARLLTIVRPYREGVA